MVRATPRVSSYFFSFSKIFLFIKIGPSSCMVKCGSSCACGKSIDHFVPPYRRRGYIDPGTPDAISHTLCMIYYLLFNHPGLLL